VGNKLVDFEVQRMHPVTIEEKTIHVLARRK